MDHQIGLLSRYEKTPAACSFCENDKTWFTGIIFQLNNAFQLELKKDWMINLEFGLFPLIGYEWRIIYSVIPTQKEGFNETAFDFLALLKSGTSYKI